MVGIDVTHAGAAARSGTPSIAAVVANTDDSFSQFPASMRMQKVDDNKESKEVSNLSAVMSEVKLMHRVRWSRISMRWW